MAEWTVANLDEARAYWATFAGKNPLNASSLVYGLINDLEDARARLAAVRALCDADNPYLGHQECLLVADVRAVLAAVDDPTFDPDCAICDHNDHRCPGCGDDTDHARPVCANCSQRAAVDGPAPPAGDWASETNRKSMEAVTKMMADAQREHAAEWAKQNRPNLGPVQRAHAEPSHEFEPTWCQRCRDDRDQQRAAVDGPAESYGAVMKTSEPDAELCDNPPADHIALFDGPPMRAAVDQEDDRG